MSTPPMSLGASLACSPVRGPEWVLLGSSLLCEACEA